MTFTPGTRLDEEELQEFIPFSWDDSEDTFPVLMSGEVLLSDQRLLQPELFNLMEKILLQENRKSESDNGESPTVHVLRAPVADYRETAINWKARRDHLRMVAEEPSNGSRLA